MCLSYLSVYNTVNMVGKLNWNNNNAYVSMAYILLEHVR